MKVVYLGSDVFLSCFEYFLKEHQLLALYTYHNDEDYFNEYTITRLAKENGIPVHYENLTEEVITRLFTEEGCELLFVAEYNRILPVPKNLPGFRAINTHSSLLPEGRSYYPIEAAMARNLSRTGVTMHIIEPELDKGPILEQRTIPITPEMDSIDIYLRCASNAREMLEKIMKDPEASFASAKPQTEKLPYWKRPDESLMTLHHDMSRAEALDMFRRYNTMTQVSLNDHWYFITGLTAGVTSLEKERFLSPSLVLFPVKDGHLRLHVRSKEVQPC